MRKAALPMVLALAVLSAGCLRIGWAPLWGDPSEGPDVTVTTLPPSPPVTHPTTTQPDDPGAVRGPVYIDSVDVLQLESYPVQVRALVKGALPTPCHQLAWDLSGPAAQGRITLDVYSTTDADAVCIQVLEPFEQSIDLGSYTGGSFVLVVDGVEYPFTI